MISLKTNMKVTYEQMKIELSEIKTYYLMKKTFDKKVRDFEETFQLLEKYLKVIKQAPTKIKGYFIERYENGSNAPQMAEKWGVSVSYVSKLKREFFKFLYEYLNKEEK